MTWGTTNTILWNFLLGAFTWLKSTHSLNLKHLPHSRHCSSHQGCSSESCSHAVHILLGRDRKQRKKYICHVSEGKWNGLRGGKMTGMLFYEGNNHEGNEFGWYLSWDQKEESQSWDNVEEDPRWREQQVQSSQSRNLLGMFSVFWKSTRRPVWLE